MFYGWIQRDDIFTYTVEVTLDEVENDPPAGQFSVRLPPDIWTLCPNCAVSVTKAKIDSSLSADAESRWSFVPRSHVDMLKDVGNASPSLKQYQLLNLARGLYAHSRCVEAEVVYRVISDEYDELLSPADWIRMAKCATASGNDSRRILLQAQDRFAAIPGLAHALGLEAEARGDFSAALDGYYFEGAMLTTKYSNEANSRIPSLAGRSGLVGRDFFQAIVLFAQAIAISDQSDELDAMTASSLAQQFKLIESMFVELANQLPENLAVRDLALRARLQYHLIERLPLGDIERDFLEALPFWHGSANAYRQLFVIAICQGNTERAKGWFLKAVDQEPFVFHRDMDAMAGTLNNDRIPRECHGYQ